ncbi:hypothetical protein IAT38_007638 [Cryptococcus sp. DSM 104549]
MAPQPSHPALVWPLSDLDISHFPQTSPPKAEGWWHEEVPEDDAKYGLYEKKTAESLCRFLKLSVDPTNQRIPMPPGYKLFVHKKNQPNGTTRADYYLFGSKHALRFRSTKEFEQHAIWLFSPETDVNNHETCNCPYSKSPRGPRGSPAVPRVAGVKRAAGSAGPSPAKVQIKKPKLNLPKKAVPTHEEMEKLKVKVVEPLDDDIEDFDGQEKGDLESEEGEEDETLATKNVPADRASELKSQRRFRRGELVWAKVNAFFPPDDYTPANLPHITHWPCVIAHHQFKNVIETPETSPTFKRRGVLRQNIVSRQVFNLRPLGMFDPKCELVRTSADMLPWAGGHALNGGREGWARITANAIDLMRKAVATEAKAVLGSHKNPLSIEKSVGQGQMWGRHWADRIEFKALNGWQDVVHRFSLAMKVAAAVANSYTYTDEILMLPDDDDLDPEDLQPYLDRTAIDMQGLYYGGERIWLDDMVRLKLPRAALSQPQFLEPSPGALERCLFMKIDKITARKFDDDDDWRVYVLGDAYELATASEEELESGNSQLMTPFSETGQVPCVESYSPPRGFTYRKINAQDDQVQCDIVDVAGRCYPDLLDAKTQAWFIDPADPEGSQGQAKVSEEVYALMGLLPGDKCFSNPQVFRDDLNKIQKSAAHGVEAKAKEEYVKMLRPELKLPQLDGDVPWKWKKVVK